MRSWSPFGGGDVARISGRVGGRRTARGATAGGIRVAPGAPAIAIAATRGRSRGGQGVAKSWSRAAEQLLRGPSSEEERQQSVSAGPADEGWDDGAARPRLPDGLQVGLRSL